MSVDVVLESVSNIWKHKCLKLDTNFLYTIHYSEHQNVKMYFLV